VLELLCSVEFEYENVSSKGIDQQDVVSTLDYSNIVLEEELYNELIKAAQLNQATKIRHLLDQLEAIPNGGAGLSAQFNELLSKYDTAGIVNVLKDIKMTKRIEEGGEDGS